MITDLRKAPFPYYGGKQHAAPAVWAALGDVCHYVEPFCGSAAVLLRRPHEANRPYSSETVNDASGLLVNALRAIAYAPDETAEAASWYVAEADVMARQLACLAWAANGNLERLMADPRWCDPQIGGWWLHGSCSWIGSGYASGDGPWIVGSDGRVTKRGRGERLQGTGDRGQGTARQRPHLGTDGQGVNHAGTRERGVARKLPCLGDDGQGVNRPQLRERGVARKLPHLGDNGHGVNHAGTREGGVARKLPHLGNNGRGVNHAGTREGGVATPIPDPRSPIPDDAGLVIPDDLTFHPFVMPELRRWFAFLSARLRHVRIVNGDWKRVCTTGALFTLPVRQGDGVAGVFLDPPYGAATGRAMGLYDQDSGSVADDVRAWCLKNGDDRRLRIVLAGFDTEHQELERHGWRVVEWFEAGFLRGGMAQQSARGHQQHRERLWCSPHCLTVAALPMDALWSAEDEDA